jgi:hypothetical protein
MRKHKVRVVVLEDGKVVVEGVPVKKGQRIEVTISVQEQVPPAYPLRGLPVRYDKPFLPATDESDWDATEGK